MAGVAAFSLVLGACAGDIGFDASADEATFDLAPVNGKGKRERRTTRHHTPGIPRRPRAAEATRQPSEKEMITNRIAAVGMRAIHLHDLINGDDATPRLENEILREVFARHAAISKILLLDHLMFDSPETRPIRVGQLERLEWQVELLHSHFFAASPGWRQAARAQAVGSALMRLNEANIPLTQMRATSALHISLILSPIVMTIDGQVTRESYERELQTIRNVVVNFAFPEHILGAIDSRIRPAPAPAPPDNDPFLSELNGTSWEYDNPFDD